MASTRFPGKPLCDLVGKPMLQWVVEAACKASFAERIVVATPDREIIDACHKFDVEAMLTSIDHPSGTDRLAEVSRAVPAQIYVNVQGDEPLIEPATIHACAAPLMADENVLMGSVYAQCPEEEIDNPAVVKVVTDWENNALYFSRFAIPYPRTQRTVPVKKHVGIYAYRRQTLEQFAGWDQTPLEKAESLEQLRFLENGVKIRMSLGEASAVAVDTPEQAEAVRLILESR
jgi:3-deoxy-manno-octulosonate cytidylyltransferase (CMP-KDO synthetase)